MTPRWRAVGVTRVTWITRLDRVGVPVAVAVRPWAMPPGVSVHSGVAWRSRDAARAAVGEAVERACAEPPPDAGLPSPSGPREDLGMTAVRSWTLGARWGGEEVWVPSRAVWFPWNDPEGARTLRHTTGLASAYDARAAAVSGLLECAERDALARWLREAAAGAAGPALDVARGLRGPARRLATRARAAGLGVSMRALSSPSGLPVVLATVWEDTPDGAWAHLGCAARPTWGGAAERALLEAVQSRLVDIHGSREDLPADREAPDPLFLAPGGDALPDEPPESGPERWIARWREHGAGEPILVDLSARAPAPWRVVRVIVAGALHPDGDP